MQPIVIRATMMMVIGSLGLVPTTSQACGLFGHCHRCQHSSQSAASSAASSSQPQQGIITDLATLVEFADRLSKLRNGDSGGSGSIEQSLKELNQKVDNLNGLIAKVEANTKAIDDLKTAHEAVANRIDNEFATKEDVRAIVREEFGKTIDSAIDEKLKKEFEELNNDQNAKFTKLLSAIRSNASHELTTAFTPFKDKEKTSPLETEWKAGTLVEALDKSSDTWKVKNADGLEGWVSRTLLEEISFN